MNKMKPNFTQIPNIIFDELLSELSGSELKVLMYIARRTYGFQKIKDKISISQIMNGIKTKNGEILDSGTGLSNKGVISAVSKLVGRGIVIEKKETTKTKAYSINLTYEKNSQVNDEQLVKKVHKTYEKSSQALVKKVHTQKKEKESSQNKDIEMIFEYWNSKEIIEHRIITTDLKKAIEKKLKEYSIDDIFHGIDVFAEVYFSEDTWWNHKWTLTEFLDRAKGFNVFVLKEKDDYLKTFFNNEKKVYVTN